MRNLQESLECRSTTQVLRLEDLLVDNKAIQPHTVFTLYEIRPSATINKEIFSLHDFIVHIYMLKAVPRYSGATPTQHIHTKSFEYHSKLNLLTK